MTPRHHTVAWASSAVRDLEEIVAWIARSSPANARKLLARLRSRAGSLQTNPRRGRVVPELAFFGVHGFRELVIKPYRIVYRIDERRVIVLAVLDGRRDLEDLLIERLIRS